MSLKFCRLKFLAICCKFVARHDEFDCNMSIVWFLSPAWTGDHFIPFSKRIDEGLSCDHIIKSTSIVHTISLGNSLCTANVTYVCAVPCHRLHFPISFVSIVSCAPNVCECVLQTHDQRVCVWMNFIHCASSYTATADFECEWRLNYNFCLSLKLISADRECLRSLTELDRLLFFWFIFFSFG